METGRVEFTLRGRGLKLDSAADMAPFVAEIEQLGSGLTHVCVSGNTFGVEAGLSLARALENKTQLRHADLSDMFTGRLRAEIPLVLSALGSALTNAPLEHLDLSDNALGPAGAIPLAPLLSTNGHIRRLTLNNNGLGVTGGIVIADALRASAPSRKAPLESIECGRNRLEDGSMSAWAACFAEHASLTCVSFPQNGIRMGGIATLVNALRSSPLTKLDVQDNTVAFKGSLALATALPSWPALAILNVGDCLLTPPGASALFAALDSTPALLSSLRSLILTYDEINAPVLAALIAVIPRMQNLDTLHLNGNTFAADSPTADNLRSTLTAANKLHILDDLDDMEVLTDDESTSASSDEDDVKDDNEDEISTPAQDRDDSVDALAAAISSTLAV